MTTQIQAPLRGQVTFGGVLRSEVIRMFSLKSTSILLAIAVVLYVAIAVVGTWGVGSLLQSMGDVSQMEGMSSMAEPGFAGETIGSGLVFSQLILGVLGVLLFSGEFTTGSAVSTFLASPQRLRVMSAKIVLIVVLTGLTQLVSSLLAFVAAKPIAENYGLVLDFGGESFQSVLWYGTLAVIMAALIGLALGVLLRNSAGGITILAGVFFVLPIITAILGSLVDWSKNISAFLPDQLGMSLATPLSVPTELELWQQLAGIAGWIIIPLALGAVLLAKRDIK
ncbi:ABC transporter permease [Glutamicibacter sp. JL.03c]|uniref:ABC transporter permease n=1 Tax=Glutamicibacter sp. JL.03c TaxID=2984842 RepID=UPI0021F76C12|nr:ABC transporter permease [Glutamicibacter sp. JL.03c]UYQ77587.1 ABC transporter permease [Glutamicibacter sp. JL.03c]